MKTDTLPITQPLTQLDTPTRSRHAPSSPNRDCCRCLTCGCTAAAVGLPTLAKALPAKRTKDAQRTDQPPKKRAETKSPGSTPVSEGTCSAYCSRNRC